MIISRLRMFMHISDFMSVAREAEFKGRDLLLLLKEYLLGIFYLFHISSKISYKCMNIRDLIDYKSCSNENTKKRKRSLITKG